jgi:hypothetical protein
MKTMIDGVVRDATPEEIAKHEALMLAAAQFIEPPAPTKEQLLAELQALTAKINALG